MNSKKNVLPCIVLVGIVVGILLKLFIIDIVKIGGESMLPTLQNNSYVFVSKIAYGIRNPFTNNYIITWKRPENTDIVLALQDSKVIVKRVVAKENDTLDFCNNSLYSISVNTRTIPLTKEQYAFFAEFKTVPKAMLLLIVDNYEKSIDSRHYGFVAEESVLGKVVLWK